MSRPASRPDVIRQERAGRREWAWLAARDVGMSRAAIEDFSAASRADAPPRARTSDRGQQSAPGDVSVRREGSCNPRQDINGPALAQGLDSAGAEPGFLANVTACARAGQTFRPSKPSERISISRGTCAGRRGGCRGPELPLGTYSGPKSVSGNTVEARIVRSARVDARRGRASGRDPKGGAVRPTGFVKLLARCPTSRYAAFLPWRPDSAAQAMTLARIPG